MLAPFPCLAEYPINGIGCDTHSPFDPWIPPEDPSYAVLCQTGGGGCPAANPPEILSHDSTEATLRATVPANFYPNRVMWRVEAGPNMDELWQYNSQEGLPIQGYWEPDDRVEFGAPGLMPNTAHRFEVAFCDASLCLCWSWPSATITTDSVHDLGLSAPAGLDTTIFAVWFAEDPMDPANEYAKASCRPDPLHPGHSIPYDPSTGFECAEMPPLETEDPALPGSYLSNPVWLRLEVKDEHPVLETVRIVATAAWDCVEGQPIENCAHKCTFTRIDGNNPVHQMYGNTGRWGVGFHDKTYRLDYFKAGEGP